MNNATTIRTEAMSVGYDGVPLISGIELSVRRGEILTLIGPNGSGKSTILKSLIRQLSLIAGVVFLDGKPISKWQDSELARRLSIVMTERMKPEWMTCWEVVATGRYPYTGRMGILSPMDRAKVDDALRLVHAENLADRPFLRISDGQRQRLMLARAICQEPEIIVLDEPTSYLDIRHKLELLSLLKSLVRKKDLAVILSLHEIDLAEKISDRIVCLNANGIDRIGTPEEIFQDEIIRELYGLKKGSYSAAFGSVELERVTGEPKVFVIGGGGSGIPVYRLLQRLGVPFAAGVIPENDLDFPVANALAAELIPETPFQPVGEEAIRRALDTLSRCELAVCTVASFGEMNQRCAALLASARERSILVPVNELRTALSANQGASGK